MKRRIFAFMLVVAMLAMTLVGCGSDTTDTTNTTNETEVNTEVEEEVVEPTEEPTTVPEVEEEVVEPTEEPTVVESETSETPEFAYSHTWSFPDNMDGFTRKYLNDDLTEWSLNETHYVANDGTEMNFTWEGPAALGEDAWSGTSTLVLADATRTYLTYAWSSALDNMDGAIKYYDKETIVTVDSNTVYNDGDYYELYDEETYDKVVFKVTRVVDNVEYIGYAVYMDNYNTMTTYQFNYLERSDVFDDTHALNVANSIDFWDDYTPLDTTIE